MNLAPHVPTALGFFVEGTARDIGSRLSNWREAVRNYDALELNLVEHHMRMAQEHLALAEVIGQRWIEKEKNS